MAFDASNLPYLQPGEFLTAAHYGVVTRSAKKNIRYGDGYSDGDGDVYANKPRSLLRPIQVHSEIEIPKFSVFGLTGEPAAGAITTYKAQKLTFESPTASPLLIATNHEIEIPEGTDGWCYLLDYNHPFPVKFSGDAPMVGHWCGVDFDTLKVCNHRTGLVCLSKPGYDEDLIDVVRAREPIRVIGKVSETITAFADGKAGKGKIVVQYRNNLQSDLIVDAFSPNDEFAFEVEVYNLSEVTREVDELVSASDTLGIGLCLEQAATSIICGFKIDSYDPSTQIARCTVMYRPCGMDKLPKEYEGKIDVMDRRCYFTDESPSDLRNREGEAAYYTVEINGYKTCRWVVFGLCCKP